jgi:G3E family GTPase
MVTVVDAVNLLRNYSSTVFLKDSGESLGEGDRRTLVDLLIEQIQFADVIVLNKIDAASQGQRDAARMIIRALNPEADVIETSFSNAPLERILNTGRFDFERAQQHPLWFKELYGFADHRPETEEYGVSNFVYRARRPFDPTKFHQFLRESWAGVIRAKGHFWIATRPQWLGELSQAGAIVRTEGLGFWWVNVPADRWPDDPFWRQSLKKNWNDVYGDRRQEIVFIGANMDQDAIKARLDACLVPGKTGMHLKEWAKLADPFPRWRRADETV